MLITCKYNPLKDLQEVVPCLSVSLKNVIQSGVIKDIGTSSVFNDITEIDSVGSRVTNQFDAYDMQRTIRNRVSASQSSGQTPVATESSATE